MLIKVMEHPKREYNTTISVAQKNWNWKKWCQGDGKKKIFFTKIKRLRELELIRVSNERHDARWEKEGNERNTKRGAGDHLAHKHEKWKNHQGGDDDIKKKLFLGFFFLVSFFGWSGVEKHRLFVYCCFNASKDTSQLDLWWEINSIKTLNCARLWCGGQAGCPLAWWWRVWRGLRTGWCPRKDQRGRPRRLPARQERQIPGNGGRSWSPGRSHGRDAGMGACGWGARWTFGSDGFREGRPCLVCSGVASWHHRWLGRICVLPWWRAACVGLCLRWIYVRFVLCVPWLKICEGKWRKRKWWVDLFLFSVISKGKIKYELKEWMEVADNVVRLVGVVVFWRVMFEGWGGTEWTFEWWGRELEVEWDFWGETYSNCLFLKLRHQIKSKFYGINGCYCFPAYKIWLHHKINYF